MCDRLAYQHLPSALLLYEMDFVDLSSVKLGYAMLTLPTYKLRP